MRKVVVVLVCELAGSGGVAAAMPPAPALAQVLHVCASPTVAAAAERGGALGWPEMRAAQTASWRSSVERNGYSVELVGWQRGERNEDSSLSFWIAHGATSYRACTYTMLDASNFLDVLSAHFGNPDSLNRSAVSVTAHWTSGLSEIDFAQVGKTGLVNISHRD